MKKLMEDSRPISFFRYATSGPNRWTRVRQHAARVAKAAGLAESCQVCNFPFTDVCHVKPVADFDPSTPLCVVNDPDNLLILCKNCHWLFDHGYPTLRRLKAFYR